MAMRSASSLSRSLISIARSSSFRSTPVLPCLRPPPTSPRLPPPRLNSASRYLGELGCTYSLLPTYNMMMAAPLTSHLAVNVRAYCELTHGT